MQKWTSGTLQKVNSRERSAAAGLALEGLVDFARYGDAGLAEDVNDLSVA